MGTYKYLTECNRAIGADRDCNPPDFRQSQLVASQLGHRRSDHACHREAATSACTNQNHDSNHESLFDLFQKI